MSATETSNGGARGFWQRTYAMLVKEFLQLRKPRALLPEFLLLGERLYRLDLSFFDLLPGLLQLFLRPLKFIGYAGKGIVDTGDISPRIHAEAYPVGHAPAQNQFERLHERFKGEGHIEPPVIPDRFLP